MSKISISVAQPIDSPELAKLIHRLTSLSLGSAVKRLAQGRTGVFYTTELFLNDHVQKDKEISQLLDFFEEHDVEPFILEIEFDQEWSQIAPDRLNDHRISVTDLRNVLLGARGRYE